MSVAARPERQAHDIVVVVNGRGIPARTGDTLSASLIRAGILATRMTRKRRPRGFFCGMGICNECIVVVDGVPGVRACVTAATDGMSVTTMKA